MAVRVAYVVAGVTALLFVTIFVGSLVPDFGKVLGLPPGHYMGIGLVAGALGAVQIIGLQRIGVRPLRDVAVIHGVAAIFLGVMGGLTLPELYHHRGRGLPVSTERLVTISAQLGGLVYCLGIALLHGSISRQLSRICPAGTVEDYQRAE